MTTDIKQHTLRTQVLVCRVVNNYTINFSNSKLYMEYKTCNPSSIQSSVAYRDWQLRIGLTYRKFTCLLFLNVDRALQQ